MLTGFLIFSMSGPLSLCNPQLAWCFNSGHLTQGTIRRPAASASTKGAVKDNVAVEEDITEPAAHGRPALVSPRRRGGRHSRIAPNRQAATARPSRRE